MNNVKIICKVRSDIEFFTRESDGVSGMSIRGLALANDVDESSMRQVLNLRGKEQPKWAKNLDIKWIDPAGQTLKNGGECKIVHADTCAQIIQYYAYAGRAKAQQSLNSFLTLGIHTFIQHITGWTPKRTNLQPILAAKEPTVEEINLIFSEFNKLDIKAELVQSTKLTAIGLSIPRLAIAAEEGKRLISAHMKTIEVPIAPRKLGVLIAKKHNLLQAPSAQKVNIALTEAGLQYLDNEKKWQLTEAGENFGQKQFDTAKNSHKTIVCLRWFPKVLAQIEKYFLEQFQK